MSEAKLTLSQAFPRVVSHSIANPYFRCYRLSDCPVLPEIKTAGEIFIYFQSSMLNVSNSQRTNYYL